MERFNASSTPLEGGNIIEASAGTGKTFTISMIYLRLIVEKGLRIDEILVVTFTLPATMELRHRIRGVIREALLFCETGESPEACIREIMEGKEGDPVVVQRLRGALKSFDEASVYTIHSFCQQILSDSAFESGALFSSEIVTDSSMNERLAADFWRREIYTLPGHLAEFIMRKESPSSLLKLYGSRPLSPRLKTVPVAAAPSVEQIGKLADLIEHLYAALFKEWRKSGDEASLFLLEGEALNRNKYNKNTMPGRVEAVKLYMAEGDSMAFPEGLDFFTSEKISGSLKKGYEAPSLPLFDAAGELNNAVDEYILLCRGYLLDLKVRFFSWMENRGREIKGETGVRGFDDLIKDLREALAERRGLQLAESVRGRYRAALIDEFQDTDDLQFDIFNGIFGNDKSILFLIGDPKQAIYRFRGADIFSYIKASKSVKRRYTLASNFRSTPELIKCVNRIFSCSANPFVFEDITFSPVEPGREDQGERLFRGERKLPAMEIGLADLAIVQSGDDDNDSIILKQLTSEISAMLGSGGYRFLPSGSSVRPQDVAVLVRSHSHAAAVQTALAGCGIPSVARGHESVFETAEAADVCRILLAVAEPGRASRVKSAAATSIAGYDAAAIFSLGEDGGEGSVGLSELTERFHGYRETWLKSGFMEMFTLFMTEERVMERVLQRGRGERAIANINHISEILNMVQFENGFTPEELAVWMENSLRTPPGGDEYSIRLDRDADAVHIVTMHACKGLEYPVVFCPYLTHAWQPPGETVTWHDLEDDSAPVICLDKESLTQEMKDRKKLEDLAENVRLMYVALTRAKSLCRVLFMIKKDFTRSAPAHLLMADPPADSIKSEERFSSFASVLKRLARESDGDISFSIVSGDGERVYCGEKIPGEDLSNRVFKGSISKTWGMQSYSSITKSSSHDKGDGFTGKADDEGEGIFAFPRGAKAGLCLHEIFEVSDFCESSREKAGDTALAILRRYGFHDSWKEDVTDMFFNVTGSVLPGCGVPLSLVGMNSRLSEMEFNFPIGEFSISGLRDLFTSSPAYGRAVYERLVQDDKSLKGMMKGFIDLVFRSGDRYYIADWKSNSLGIRSSDYTLPRMEEEMFRHNYHLQYYLYTVALHRYLSLRMGSTYSYDKNFGGVYYLFIRGMTGGDGSPGIFHALPDCETVMRLDSFFRGEVQL